MKHVWYKLPIEWSKMTFHSREQSNSMIEDDIPLAGTIEPPPPPPKKKYIYIAQFISTTPFLGHRSPPIPFLCLPISPSKKIPSWSTSPSKNFDEKEAKIGYLQIFSRTASVRCKISRLTNQRTAGNAAFWLDNYLRIVLVYDIWGWPGWQALRMTPGWQCQCLISHMTPSSRKYESLANYYTEVRV